MIARLATALAVMLTLSLFNILSSRASDRAYIEDQIADLSRGTADLSRQLSEYGRRLSSVESDKFGAASRAPDPFTDKYIFPGYHLPSLSQMTSASEGARLIASDVEMLRLHYAYMLDQWYDRTVAAKDQIVALYDEDFYRMWIFYLAGASAAFRYGGLVNYQLQFARNRHALPITRDYMAAAEAKLRG